MGIDSRLLALHPPRSWTVEGDIDWPALDVSLISPIVRDALGRTYAKVLRAEHVGLRVAHALLEAAPEGALRDVARTQYEEELRHVAFFERISTLLGAARDESPNLLALDEFHLELRDYRSLMLLMQVLESAANTVFVVNAKQNLRLMGSGVRLPGTEVLEAIVHAVTDLVGKDEARHVAFGMRVLRSQFEGITPRELRVAQSQVQTACALMQATFAELELSSRALGFARGEILERVADGMKRYFAHLEIAST